VRLADVRLPRLWLLALLAALLLTRRSDQHAVVQAQRIGRELGEAVNDRWRTSDERTDELLALTRTLKWLTWALFAVAAATLAATGLGLVVAIG
jgi:hypothetical protein